MAKIEFAPDGKHYRTLKKGTLGNMYNYFTQDIWIREHLTLNPFARFRLIGEEKIIGVLAYDSDKKKFLHLKGE